MLFILVTSLHVLAAAILIMFILLHAGRGGGLSDMFGGGMGLGGSTVAEKNLDRMTVFAASLFTITTISLGFLIADRDATPDPAPIPTSSGSPFPTGSDIPPIIPTGTSTGSPTGASTASTTGSPTASQS